MENEIGNIIKESVTEVLNEFRAGQPVPVEHAKQVTIERLDGGYLVCCWGGNGRRIVRAEIEDALADASNFLLDIK